MASARVKGRFAPSPSGRMHLGNIFTAVASWLSAKSQGGTWLLRIEDLDRGRSREEYARLIEDDLAWLGLYADEGGMDGHGNAGPYRQSLRGAIYEEYLERLRETGLTYACTCRRADIMATQAPHGADGRVVYSGRCRPTTMPQKGLKEPAEVHSIRLYVADKDMTVEDATYGHLAYNLARDCGDFILRRADGAWAYQLAVVVDDALMGVTEVVRGSDLMMSAAQQAYVYDLLGLRCPQWRHVPLICNGEGRRLSKRDAAAGMWELRRRYTPGQVLAMVGGLLGIADCGDETSLDALLDAWRRGECRMLKDAPMTINCEGANAFL